MLNVSSEFKSAIKQLAVFSDGKVDIVNSNGTISFNKDELIKIDIYGSAFINDKVLGNLAQHSLTLELLGNQTSTISLNQENIVRAYIGVDLDITTEFVQFQDFLITEVSYNDTTNVTRIIGTDNIIKLNTNFVDTITYPITLKDYLIEVLDQCDLELENITFLNSSFSITSKPFSDYTNAREIVSKVAELALCFVRVNKVSNKIELVGAFTNMPNASTYDDVSIYTYDQLSVYTYNQIAYEFYTNIDDVDRDVYWNLKFNDHYFGTKGINTLVLNISQVVGENNSKENAINVAIDGVVEQVISDNPFINTEALRLSVLDDMFDEVDEFIYQPFNLEYRGFPYLEVGDIIILETMSGSTRAVPIYEYNIRYDGGLYGRVGAKALSKTETKYINTQTLAQRVKAAEVIVDKVDGEVTILAGDYYDGKLQGTYYNFDGTAFTITNSLDEVVFSADNQGNLTLVGDIKGVKDGVTRVEMQENSIKFFDSDAVLRGNIYTNLFEGVQQFYFSNKDDYWDSNGAAGLKVNSFSGIGNNVWHTVDMNSIGSGVDGFNGYLRTASSSTSGLTILSSSKKSNAGGTTMISMESSNAEGQVFISAGSWSPTYKNSSIGITKNYISLNAGGGQYFITLGGVQYILSRDSNGFLKAT